MTRRVHLTGLFLLGSGMAEPQSPFPELNAGEVELHNLNSYAALVRADLRKQRRTLVEESIGLEAARAPAFRAVYDRYERDFQTIWDLRLENTKAYAESQKHLTDSDVEKLARRFLDTDRRMNELRKKYYDEFRSAVGPRLAARFLHVEGVLSRVIELQVLAIVPMVP